MDLVLDIGNYRLKGAIFVEDRLLELFTLPLEPTPLKEKLRLWRLARILVSSVNQTKEKDLLATLPFYTLLDFSKVKVPLDVDEPQEVGHDRIANVYGALFHFPQNDCIVVDMGTAVTFDYVGCNGHYLGGAIYPGVEIGAKGLAQYTARLPAVDVEKPETSVGKTTKTHIQSGLYWGLLGAIERITFEIRSQSENPSNVKVLATGGLLVKWGESFTEDLKELVDLIDPALTLIGLHETMKEMR